MINRQLIAEIKRANRIEDVLPRYVRLKQSGHKFVGHCPFPDHRDTHPSFVVYPETQSFRCFGCGRSGDVISFIQGMEHVEFIDALQILAKRAGLALPKIGKEEEEMCNHQSQIHKILDEARIFYHTTLLGKPDRKEELIKRRGFTEDIIEEYSIGITPKREDGLTEYLMDKGYQENMIIEAGVSKRQGSKLVDYFQDRFIYPVIRDGRTGYLTGRSIKDDNEPKWKNLAKAHGILLFNERALKEKTVFLTEGIPDAITLLQNGFNATAILGVNAFKEDYVTLFKGVDTIYICFDDDENTQGQEAAKKVADIFSAAGFSVKVIHLPRPEGEKQMDVNKYFLNHTKSDFVDLVNEAEDMTKEGSLRILSETHDEVKFKSHKGYTYVLSNIDFNKQRITLLDDKREMIYQDNVNLASGHNKTVFIHKCIKLSSEIKLNDRILEKELLYIRNYFQKPKKSLSEESEEEKPCMSDEERKEAMEFLKDPNIMDRIVEDMECLGCVGEEINKKIAYLVATSRKLKKSMSCRVGGPSSSGKSTLGKTILDMMPEGEYLDLTRLTPRSFDYVEKDFLKHKFVFMAEREGATEANYSIRLMQTERKLTTLVTIQDPKTNRPKTVSWEVEGPIAYMETTIETSNIDPQNLTRVFSLYADESEPQTVKVLEALGKEKTLEGLYQEEKKERIRRKHKNAQRLLNLIPVDIPYTSFLSFPTRPVRVRRDYERFLALIEAVALLRQYQKVKIFDRKIGEYIKADLKDYEIVYNLKNILRQTLDPLGGKARECLIMIKEMLDERGEDKEKTFTRKDVADFTGWNQSLVHQCTIELVKKEEISVVEGGRGKRYVYEYIHSGDPRTSEIKELLTPKELQEKLWQEDRFKKRSISFKRTARY